MAGAPAKAGGDTWLLQLSCASSGTNKGGADSGQTARKPYSGALCHAKSTGSESEHQQPIHTTEKQNNPLMEVLI